jgi:hypothetical protein
VPRRFTRGWRGWEQMCAVPEGLGFSLTCLPKVETVGYDLSRPRRSELPVLGIFTNLYKKSCNAFGQLRLFLWPPY